MRRVVLVSATYVDIILTVPHYPSEDDKLRAGSLLKRRGGNGANTAEVLRQLLVAGGVDDVQLELVSVLPARESAASKLIRNSLPGVDCSRCIYREDNAEPASSYIIRSQETGSRTSVSHSGLAEMTVDEFKSIADGLGEAACWYHFEGRTPETLHGCIDHLRCRWPNVKVSLELENPNRVGLNLLLPLADVLFFSKTWAHAHGFTSAEAFLRHTEKALGESSALLFCTWGAQGADALRCDGGTHVHVDALDVDSRSVVDTVGAGDTFIAGILRHLLQETKSYVLADALGFAGRLAGRKVQQEGFALLEQS